MSGEYNVSLNYSFSLAHKFFIPFIPIGTVNCKKVRLVMTHPNVLSNNLPPPPDFENKFQRSVGIMIGFGIGLALICFVAAQFEYSNYSDISRILSNGGIESQGYLARDLVKNTLNNTAFYLAFGVAGILMAIFGLLSSRSNIF